MEIVTEVQQGEQKSYNERAITYMVVDESCTIKIGNGRSGKNDQLYQGRKMFTQQLSSIMNLE